MNNMDRTLARFSISIASACLIAVVVANPALAQDYGKPAAAPAKEAAKPGGPGDERGRKVHVDNDKVRATDVSYAPGSSSGMLERGQRVVRALTDGTLEKTLPDGRKETVTWKAGDVRFFPKETYSQKNIGKTELVLFTTTIK